jgi:hypothetical protein
MPNYHFGKHPGKHDYRTLFQKLRHSGASGAAALLQCSYQKLKTSNRTTLFPLDGNDTLGDCTIADLAHSTTVYNDLLGKEKIMPKASVLALYQ